MNAHRTMLNTSPATLKSLTMNESIVLLAMRKSLEGKAGLPDIHHLLFDMFGIFYIEMSILAFEAMVNALAENSRGTFYLFRPTCQKVSNDELSILNLIAACQNGNGVSVNSMVSEIVEPNGADKLLGAVSFLAEALDARRSIFSLRGYRPLPLLSVSGSA